jgi:hypothetical protein
MRDLPPWWLWMQVVLVLFVVAGMVIAVVKLSTT